MTLQSLTPTAPTFGRGGRFAAAAIPVALLATTGATCIHQAGASTTAPQTVEASADTSQAFMPQRAPRLTDNPYCGNPDIAYLFKLPSSVDLRRPVPWMNYAENGCGLVDRIEFDMYRKYNAKRDGKVTFDEANEYFKDLGSQPSENIIPKNWGGYDWTYYEDADRQMRNWFLEPDPLGNRENVLRRLDSAYEGGNQDNKFSKMDMFVLMNKAFGWGLPT